MSIPDNRIAELTTLLAASVPVLAVAFYAVRNAPDEVESLPAREHSIQVREWFWDRLKPIRWALKRANFVIDTNSRGLIFIRKRWRVGTDRGFTYRATPAFLFALCPWLLGYDDRWGRVLLGVALVLVVFSFNALIIYSTVITALRMDHPTVRCAEGHAAPESAGTNQDASRDTSQAGGQTPDGLEELLKDEGTYGGDSIVVVNIVGLLTGAASVVAGFVVALSVPPLT